jgi:hypothetical protein
VLLLTLNGSQISKTFLYDFEKLGLPENIKKNCENYYNSLRLTWQITIESSSSFDEIKKRLHKNGYKNIQIDNSPLFLNLETSNQKIFEKIPRIMLQKKI